MWLIRNRSFLLSWVEAGLGWKEGMNRVLVWGNPGSKTSEPPVEVKRESSVTHQTFLWARPSPRWQVHFSPAEGSEAWSGPAHTRLLVRPRVWLAWQYPLSHQSTGSGWATPCHVLGIPACDHVGLQVRWQPYACKFRGTSGALAGPPVGTVVGARDAVVTGPT